MSRSEDTKWLQAHRQGQATRQVSSLLSGRSQACYALSRDAELLLLSTKRITRMEWEYLSSIDLNKVVQSLDNDGSVLCDLVDDLFARDMDFRCCSGSYLSCTMAVRLGSYYRRWSNRRSALTFHHALISFLNRIRSDPPCKHSIQTL